MMLTSLLIDLPVPAVILAKATALLAAAWILHFALARRNPRWRVLIWRLAMVGLILLPPAEWLLPKLRLPIETAPAVESMQDEPLIVTVAAQAQPAATPVAHPVPPKPTIFKFAERHWVAISGMIWACVVLIVAARSLYVFIRLRSLVRSASPADGSIRELAGTIAHSIGCRAPELRLTPDLLSPFVAGIRKPVIVIPALLAVPSRKTDLPAILAHEMAHIRSGDLVWMAFARWIGALLWFHPLAWKMLSAHGGACEEVCDAVAAEHTGGAPAYSRSLASTFLELAVDAPSPIGVPMIRPAEIMRRIKALRSGIQFRALTPKRIFAASVLGAIAVCALGLLQFVHAETQPSAGRTIEFPSDHAIGRVSFYSARGYGRTNVPARGGVAVPPGDDVELTIAPAELKSLASLKPDDIQSLYIWIGKDTEVNLEPVADLPGLNKIVIRKYTGEAYRFSADQANAKDSKPDTPPISGKDLEKLAVLPNLTDLHLLVNLEDKDLDSLRAFPRIRRLELQIDKMNGGGLEVLKDLPRLESLSLVNAAQDTASGFDPANLIHIRSCASLKALSLHVNFGDEDIARLSPLPKIETLEIDASRMTDDGLAALRNFSGLKKMRIFSNSKGPKGPGLIVLTEMPTLQDVSISMSNMTDEALDNLKGLKSITSLRLNDTQLTDAGLAALEGMSNMSELELASHQIGDDGLRHIQNLVALKALWLRTPKASDAGMANLAGLVHLEKLELRNVPVGSAGVAHLKTLTEMRTLNLAGSRVGDSGIDSLRNMASLENLALSGTNIGDGAIDKIAALKSLRSLGLNNTLVTTEGLVRLKAALPECEISYEPPKNQFLVDVEFLESGSGPGQGIDLAAELFPGGSLVQEDSKTHKITPMMPPLNLVPSGNAAKIPELVSAGRLRILSRPRLMIVEDSESRISMGSSIPQKDPKTGEITHHDIGDKLSISVAQGGKGMIRIKKLCISSSKLNEKKQIETRQQEFSAELHDGMSLLVTHPFNPGQYILMKVERRPGQKDR